MQAAGAELPAWTGPLVRKVEARINTWGHTQPHEAHPVASEPSGREAEEDAVAGDACQLSSARQLSFLGAACGGELPFEAVEAGVIEYEAGRGASLDPHIDDSWVWGDRVVTTSLLAPCVMTFRQRQVEIRVELPPRSVMVFAGEARYRWQHGIRARDVSARRISVTLRELGRDFMPDGARAEEGRAIRDLARSALP
ncbi:hypothetical protein T484DRAFT_1941324 [Baffinella frigidus]|nr:hypothetical protein T484DRAFT_1941324 [Cryptophyta sp. CCMP2293]